MKARGIGCGNKGFVVLAGRVVRLGQRDQQAPVRVVYCGVVGCHVGPVERANGDSWLGGGKGFADEVGHGDRLSDECGVGSNRTKLIVFEGPQGDPLTGGSITDTVLSWSAV